MESQHHQRLIGSTNTTNPFDQTTRQPRKPEWMANHKEDGMEEYELGSEYDGLDVIQKFKVMMQMKEGKLPKPTSGTMSSATTTISAQVDDVDKMLFSDSIQLSQSSAIDSMSLIATQSTTITGRKSRFERLFEQQESNQSNQPHIVQQQQQQLHNMYHSDFPVPNYPGSNAMPSQSHMFNLLMMSTNQPADTKPMPHALSERQVLEQLGVKPPSSRDNHERNQSNLSEDELGMQKVMAALSHASISPASNNHHQPFVAQPNNLTALNQQSSYAPQQHSFQYAPTASQSSKSQQNPLNAMLMSSITGKKYASKFVM